MADTLAQFRVQPIRYEQTAITADSTYLTADAITAPPPVPTSVVFATTAAGQMAPAASYDLEEGIGWLYSTTIPEALDGVYYWYAIDEAGNLIVDGYIRLADTTETYRPEDGVELRPAVYVLPAAALQDLEPGTSRLVGYRGSRAELSLQIVDAAGVAVDLSNRQLSLQLGKSASAAPLQTVAGGTLVPFGDDSSWLAFTPDAVVVSAARDLVWSLYDVTDPLLPVYLAGGALEVRAALPPAS